MNNAYIEGVKVACQRRGVDPAFVLQKLAQATGPAKKRTVPPVVPSKVEQAKGAPPELLDKADTLLQSTMKPEGGTDWRGRPFFRSDVDRYGSAERALHEARDPLNPGESQFMNWSAKPGLPPSTGDRSSDIVNNRRGLVAKLLNSIRYGKPATSMRNLAELGSGDTVRPLPTEPAEFAYESMDDNFTPAARAVYPKLTTLMEGLGTLFGAK